jgi:hypothetical protein
VTRTVSVLLLLGVAVAAGQHYDHVVVTARSHVSAFGPLSGWVESGLGMTDTVVAVEDIISAYPGRDTQEKVRSFVSHAYSDWGTTHVLLGGDTDVVPHRLAYVYRYGRTQNIPCDLYYADLDGNWDLDGDNVFGELEDSVDLYPEVSVGRATASTAGEAAWFVSRVLAYVADSAASYLDRVLLSGFDLHDEPVIRGEYHCEIVDTTRIPDVMRPCLKVYDSHSGNHKSDIIQALDAGRHIWVHADHSSWWSVGAGYKRHGTTISYNEMNALTNGDDYTVGLINGCHAGAFDSSDCVVEAFVSAPNGGGVAAFANSRPGLTIDPDWHRAGSFLQAQYLIDAIINQDSASSLAAHSRLQAFIAPLADTSPTYRWCQYQYNMFGDPAMPVWVPGLTGVEESVEYGGMRTGLRIPTVMRAPELVRLDVRVLDALGREVTNQRQHLAPGVYFVVMDGERQTPKVLIAR